MDPVTEERRIIERKSGLTIAPVRLRRGDAEIFAAVQDISVTGIGVLTRQHVEPGTWLILEPGAPGRYLSPELPAEVRHTTQYNDTFLLGCRFARFLTTEDIMALG